MSDPPFEQTPKGEAAQSVPPADNISARHRAVLDELRAAVEHGRLLTVFVADARSEASKVMNRLLGGLDREQTIVRLNKPFHRAIDSMRAIIRGLDFDPKDLSLEDLDSILDMFLSFQSKHHRQTILCIEQAQLQVHWLLDYVRKLVEREIGESRGLVVLLSGQPQLLESFDAPPFVGLRERAGRPIRLAQFTLADTREYLRQRAEAIGADEIAEIFEFDAISRMHDLSGGLPDVLARLCLRSLKFARQRGTGAVSARIVADAHKFLEDDRSSGEDQLMSNSSEASGDEHSPGIESADLLSESSMLDMRDASTRQHRELTLIVSRFGKKVQEFPLRLGRFLVGRAEFADLHLDSKEVSRRHALIVKTGSDLTLMDLGSTNGTFVNGRRAPGDAQIAVGDVIAIGDCRIECVATH